MSVLYIDSETTGLDPRVHVPWEVAIVEPDGTEQVWCWRPSTAAMEKADPDALRIGGFHQRAPKFDDVDNERRIVHAVAAKLDGAVLVGSKPSFDMEMLASWFRLFVGVTPTWHHRPVCVATMAYGWLSSVVQFGHDDRQATLDALTLPWSSDDLSRACGIDPDAFDRHTALGDARWVKAWFERLTGGGS